MARKSIIVREARRFKTVEKYAAKKAKLKEIIKNGTPEEAWHARIQISQLPRNAHAVRTRSRCQLTGRPRGVYRKFGLSRNKLREMFNQGLIPGMTKSSW
ncbi:MAG: 30S ribosomal protein S14 [Gammaproteobacteria bacterium]|nr:30S ribosomal protein S14 [Gammaproteobacteria bacterium]